MKKYLFGFTALLLAVTLSFAFTTKTETKVFATQIYEYTPGVGVPNPPTTKAQVTSVSNWAFKTVAPTCDGLSNLFCRIEFDNTTTTLAQALDIIGERVRLHLSIAHNTQYTDGAGHFVKIFLKS